MNLGYRMFSAETPMGFTFNPYQSNTERWNFLEGCKIAVFGRPQ
jgi:hypothetical protein